MLNTTEHNGSLAILSGAFAVINYNDYRIPIDTRDLYIAGSDDQIASHWHDEMELLHVIRGSINIRIDEEDHLLTEGECFFINAKTVHSVRMGQDPYCHMSMVVFRSSFAGIGQTEEKLVENHLAEVMNRRFIHFHVENDDAAGSGIGELKSGCSEDEAAEEGNANADKYRTTEGKNLQREIGSTAETVIELKRTVPRPSRIGSTNERHNITAELAGYIDNIASCKDSIYDDVLYVIGNLHLALYLVRKNTEPAEVSGPKGESKDVLRFRSMISYIHDNYMNKISLDNIASAAGVSRSKCCRLFRNQAGQSPAQFIGDYRLEKSRNYLEKTTVPIAEVAQNCGFPQVTYFDRVFLDKYGQTPLKYRKQYQMQGE